MLVGRLHKDVFMARACATLATSTIALFLLCSAVQGQDSPALLRLEATIPIEAANLAFGYGSAWAMSKGRMVRINSGDNSTAEIEVPTSADSSMLMELDKYRAFAVGENAVWIPDMASSSILKVDPQLGKMTMTIATDIFGGKGSIGVGEGSVWVVTFDTHDKTL